MIINGRNGNDYRVNFRYERGLTQCIVERVKAGGQFKTARDLELSGAASCDKRDNFCKETGRKIALARAVETMPRSERQIVWEGYRARKKS